MRTLPRTPAMIVTATRRTLTSRQTEGPRPLIHIRSTSQTRHELISRVFLLSQKGRCPSFALAPVQIRRSGDIEGQQQAAFAVVCEIGAWPTGIAAIISGQ